MSPTATTKTRASRQRAKPQSTGRSLAQLMNLAGRRALVTGGAGHMGYVVGATLAELGAAVALLDLEEVGCRRRAEALARQHPTKTVIAVPCDLGDEPAARRAVHDALRQLGGLDILVHCAAHVGSNQQPGWSVSFEQQTVNAWDAALRVNLTSAFVLVQEAREALAASGRGSVILISSIYGLVGPDWRLYEGTGMANPAAYGASKGGLLQLMRYLATTLAPHIRVNAITPGGVQRAQPEVFQQRYVARTPLGRMATEDDIKGAIAYLASDLSSYVTGHNLVVDGGWTAW